MEDINLTIAKITHEIRNPLTLINSSLQLIERTHPEVKDFPFWSQTLEDVEYLNQLLDDLAAAADLGGAPATAAAFLCVKSI